MSAGGRRERRRGDHAATLRQCAAQSAQRRTHAPAGTDLEEEGAVHAVLLCAEDGGQVLRLARRDSVSNSAVGCVCRPKQAQQFAAAAHARTMAAADAAPPRNRPGRATRCVGVTWQAALACHYLAAPSCRFAAFPDVFAQARRTSSCHEKRRRETRSHVRAPRRSVCCASRAPPPGAPASCASLRVLPASPLQPRMADELEAALLVELGAVTEGRAAGVRRVAPQLRCATGSAECRTCSAALASRPGAPRGTRRACTTALSSVRCCVRRCAALC